MNNCDECNRSIAENEDEFYNNKQFQVNINQYLLTLDLKISHAPVLFDDRKHTLCRTCLISRLLFRMIKPEPANEKLIILDDRRRNDGINTTKEIRHA